MKDFRRNNPNLNQDFFKLISKFLLSFSQCQTWNFFVLLYLSILNEFVCFCERRNATLASRSMSEVAWFWRKLFRCYIVLNHFLSIRVSSSRQLIFSKRERNAWTTKICLIPVLQFERKRNREHSRNQRKLSKLCSVWIHFILIIASQIGGGQGHHIFRLKIPDVKME